MSTAFGYLYNRVTSLPGTDLTNMRRAAVNGLAFLGIYASGKHGKGDITVS